MYCTRQFIYAFIILICTFYAARAQDIPAYRWEPGISIRNKLTDNWTTTFQLKARIQANTDGENEWGPMVKMNDIRGYLAYTLFNQSRLQIGYIIRMNDPFEDDPFYERRLVQQYSFFNSYGKHRLSHSFTLEERIIRNQFTGRLRYGIGDDFPLQGEVLDKGEYFFYSNLQFLYSFNAFSNGLENRVAVGFGKLFQSGNKFTFNIESRYTDLIHGNRQLIIQLNTVYYISW
jgi:hypothetical protein